LVTFNLPAIGGRCKELWRRDITDGLAAGLVIVFLPRHYSGGRAGE
jgi:hypothetical protein